MLTKSVQIIEIKQITVSKRTSWTYFDNAPDWERYELLPKKFGPYFVLKKIYLHYIIFTILDPSEFVPVSKSGKTHDIKGISQNIPRKAIVGGIELYPDKIPQIGQQCYFVDYLALHPRYQGKNLALKLYLWLIDNADITKIGIIGAGESQSPGGIKLWRKLAQHAFVFAYSPKEKKFSHVELAADGELEADFEIYEKESTLEKLHREYNIEYERILAQLSKKYKNQKEFDAAFEKAIVPFDKKYKASIADLEAAEDVFLYVTKRK